MDGEVTYLLRRRKRRTLGVVVFPDGTVEARVPTSAPLHEVQSFVERRKEWIRKKLGQFADLPKPPEQHQWIDGEHIPILGQKRALRVLSQNPLPRQYARLDDNEVTVVVRDSAIATSVQRAFYRWVRRFAQQYFHSRVVCWVEGEELGNHSYPALEHSHLMADLGAPTVDFSHPAWERVRKAARRKPPTVAVRRMKRRWGSCHTDGRIFLNLDLIAAAPDIIDYVVVHELCHLVEMNHSPRFYALMTDLMPDWNHRRRLLNTTVPIGNFE